MELASGSDQSPITTPKKLREEHLVSRQQFDWARSNNKGQAHPPRPAIIRQPSGRLEPSGHSCNTRRLLLLAHHAAAGAHSQGHHVHHRAVHARRGGVARGVARQHRAVPVHVAHAALAPGADRGLKGRALVPVKEQLLLQERVLRADQVAQNRLQENERPDCRQQCTAPRRFMASGARACVAGAPGSAAPPRARGATPGEPRASGTSAPSGVRAPSKAGGLAGGEAHQDDDAHDGSERAAHAACEPNSPGE